MRYTSRSALHGHSTLNFCHKELSQGTAPRELPQETATRSTNSRNSRNNSDNSNSRNNSGSSNSNRNVVLINYAEPDMMKAAL